MATIRKLMPYLRKGHIANDRVRRAYLHPKIVDGTLAFEWTEYLTEGEWATPVTHSEAYVLTWTLPNWGILYRDSNGNEYSTDDIPTIEEEIAKKHVYTSIGFVSPE